MTIPRPLWRRLALAGFGIVLLACTAMGILSWFKQSNVNDHAIAADLDRSAHAILQDLAAQTRVDLAVAETVANEPGNAALVAADSRDEILRKYSPIVQPLKTQTGAGLVTFVKFDGTSVVAFARGHDPKAFGDDLSKRRKMVGVAVREGRAVMGIELGRAALCAFATVPWTVDGKVIGAVDVGTELTDAYFSRLKDVYGVDISLHLMRGTSLSPQNFTFPEKSFLSPDEAKAVFDGADVRKVVAKGDTHVAVTAVTLKDFSGGSIGVMEIAHDVTALIDAQRMSLEVTIASVVIVAILSLLLFTYFARSIARPIRALTQGMNRLAAGDLTVEIGGRGRADEIGAMAAAVQVFKDNAIALDQATLDRTRLAGETEAGRLKREGERVALAREQTNVVQSLATGLAHLSSGDLTHRIEGTLAIEYRALQEDFNAAVERLRETMEGVVSTARDILSGTSDIAKSSDDLSRRTEQQAAALEETSASMAEISRIVQTTAESARLGASVMASAKSSAEQSAHIVHEAAGAMAAIEDSSRKIGNIIGVIDEIAFQTNLLALNAGVEAARAGDAGRGFAVVASEVRGLAQRSAEAAKEIKALIMASASQVEQGVTLVGRTEKALAEIAAQVIEMNTMVGAIAASADDQATSLGQVRTAITQMDHVTQQNAAMVEESTSAVHALAEEAAKLDGMVGHFKLGDDRAMGHAPVARNGAQYGKARRG